MAIDDIDENESKPELRTDVAVAEPAIRVLLLDDDPENLMLRAAILRKFGYFTETAATIEEAQVVLDQIDIAVLDYHLGAGKFGTEVASDLRERRPEVPIIILSATLERHFGGVEDMHLLKGSSSVDDLIAALRSFEAKRRGSPVVVDARDFFYSRINMAIGEDVVLEILDADGNWLYVNEACARLVERPRDWFPGRNLFETMPELAAEWRGIIHQVAHTRTTYIDRTYQGLLNLHGKRPEAGQEWAWSILAFPITLHNNQTGVVMTARVLERRMTT
jgi:CheY-like chemotaxis protein